MSSIDAFHRICQSKSKYACTIQCAPWGQIQPSRRYRRSAGRGLPTSPDRPVHRRVVEYWTSLLPSLCMNAKFYTLEMPARTSTKKDNTPETQLEGFLDKFTPDVARLARACLTKMRARLPGAIQLVYDNYNALA